MGLCTVGLTGGLGSGKSSVATLLAGYGAAVLDADQVVHELYRPKAAGAVAVAAEFGPSVLAEDGSVDRQRLGRLVLAQPGALDRLNALVHPLVHRRIGLWLEGLEEAAVAVVEAALMVESGSYRRYDLLAVVWCRPEQQLARAVARGFERDRARALIDAQMSLDAKRDLADVVVDNSGPLSCLPGEVARAWGLIRRRCSP